MRFNTDPVAYNELIHGLTQGYNGPGPLMSRRKRAIRQGKRKMPIIDLEVGATGPTHSDLYQHLARARLRHRSIDHTDVLWSKEDSRAHRLRDRTLLHNGRECQCHS